jgi:phospholipid transport system substrate-binding protein
MSGFHLGRRNLLALIAGLTATPVAGAFAQDTSAVTAPIQQFYGTLLTIMREGRTTPFTQRFDTLAPSLDQALNVPFLLQLAIGLAWTAVPASQQSVLLGAFRQYTVATWVSNFDSYSGQKLVVLPTLRTVGTSRVVHTEIVKADGSSSVIDYVMRPAGTVWKATDVLLDGSISQVAVLRSDFSTLLMSGPNALAENLRRKTTDLMDSTAPM